MQHAVPRGSSVLHVRLAAMHAATSTGAVIEKLSVRDRARGIARSANGRRSCGPVGARDVRRHREGVAYIRRRTSLGNL